LPEPVARRLPTHMGQLNGSALKYLNQFLRGRRSPKLGPGGIQAFFASDLLCNQCKRVDSPAGIAIGEWRASRATRSRSPSATAGSRRGLRPRSDGERQSSRWRCDIPKSCMLADGTSFLARALPGRRITRIATTKANTKSRPTVGNGYRGNGQAGPRAGSRRRLMLPAAAARVGRVRLRKPIRRVPGRSAAE